MTTMNPIFSSLMTDSLYIRFHRQKLIVMEIVILNPWFFCRMRLHVDVSFLLRETVCNDKITWHMKCRQVGKCNSMQLECENFSIWVKLLWIWKHIYNLIFRAEGAWRSFCILFRWATMRSNLSVNKQPPAPLYERYLCTTFPNKNVPLSRFTLQLVLSGFV